MPISKQQVTEKFFFKEFHKEGKEKYEKEHKEKHEKDFKEVKEFHKEISKIEFLEYQPQLPQIPDPGPEAATEQATDAFTKNPEKYAFNEKIHPEKIYKIEFDKHYVFDKHPYSEYTAGPVAVAPGVPVEQRLAALEAAMAQLIHFIPQELRPDLSKGALKQEPAEKPEEEKK